MTEWQRLPDLANRRLGGSVVWANDESFAERENLIRPTEPVFQPATFGHKGQVYDGWETRRRREPGSDHAVVRLGLPGVVRGVVVDTAFFTGNYPPECSVEACSVEGYPSPEELMRADWHPLVPRAPLSGDTRNPFPVTDPHRYTHVRLTIHPDGGVARLRVHGEPVPDPRFLDPASLDLAALENGATISGCSNMFYSSPANLISPGHAAVMGEGWETARRRDDANDWVSVRLAAPGTLRMAELDTSHFKGNAPARATLTTGDAVLLNHVRLQPDTRHRFLLPPTEATEVRLDIHPDGGMARLRLWGSLTPATHRALHLHWFNLLPEPHAIAVLTAAGLPAPQARETTTTRPHTTLPAPLTP
ncbi:allantoicase [Actinophytocola gossypii]|uniref:Probable allantoicase n=1 Tax=Actinophytocola gossypii TaxID=2812003 RepID=A0ABT2JA46_9PSEU|nr:allantoicase [Actinophytocola gossypii]MCT2584737.1 allantoicase [Actinophytocola gossypii]